MLPVEVSDLASAELEEAHAWYEERALGLGEELLREFRATCARVSEFPHGYQIVEREQDQPVRRAPVRRFPYGVFYQLEADRIVVTAFFHAKRDPTRRATDAGQQTSED